MSALALRRDEHQLAQVIFLANPDAGTHFEAASPTESKVYVRASGDAPAMIELMARFKARLIAAGVDGVETELVAGIGGLLRLTHDARPADPMATDEWHELVFRICKEVGVNY